ncbi:MAG TPA: polymer-forming cytoskeletal protein [Saprospiraceae bacterium]|nr:polymer-forming cytoskeletal protein [Saprospiraceae bacterium]HMP15089.1 polymer-forming cytoskeletal protein [Saprospiraceae bacterium]
MFGNSNNKTEAGKPNASVATGALNTLVQGTLVEGIVHSDSDIRVDGTIKGKLFCDAKVIIGVSGTIEGEIKCRNAVIEGKFQGNLEVTELLNIRETATVGGDVKTNKLIVQSGAAFNVNCTMGGVRVPTNTLTISKEEQPVLKAAK